MEDVVDVVIEDPRWEAFGLQDMAARVILAAFAELGLPRHGMTLCLMGCDDARIGALNAGFRGKAAPTNVLSWPSEERACPGATPTTPEPGSADDPLSLGDIAISFDTCMREAQAAGKPPADHVCHLIAHGLLHLLGYDHITDTDAAIMEAAEARILATLGISDPYEDNRPPLGQFGQRTDGQQQ